MIRNLDLGLEPRIRPKRPSRWLSAYLEPLALAAFCGLWCVGGFLAYVKMVENQFWALARLSLLLVWAWILFRAARQMSSVFLHRYRLRKLIHQKRSENLWPELYVDRQPGERS